MEGFHGSFAKMPLLGALSHFGSLEAAAHRLESIFAVQTPKVLTERGFVLFDRAGQPTALKSEAELFAIFGESMSKAAIFEVALDITKPLRLKDCWGDDPIGSGGTALFVETDGLLPANRKSLCDLFNPFSGIIYPDQIDEVIRKGKVDIRALEQQIARSPVFVTELKKRQDRLGKKRYERDRPYEVVWTALTLRLRKWALENGHDSFVYHNDREGAGDCHVILTDKQVQGLKRTYRFDQAQFRDLIPQAVEQLRTRFWDSARRCTGESQGETIADAFLYGLDVGALWKPVPPQASEPR